MPMAFQLLLVISGVESPTQATEDSDVLTNKAEKKINEYFKKCGCKTTIMNGYGMSEVCAAVSVNYGQ